MKRALLSIAVVICLIHAQVRADEPAQPASTPRFVLNPGSDVTVVAGEPIELSVMSTRDQRVVDPAKIIWTVNDQEPGKIDAAFGSLTLPADAAHGGPVIYKAPPSAPAGKKTITIAAKLFQSGSFANLKSTITIADSLNWVAIDGDTGMGPREVSIVLDKDVSAAGMQKPIIRRAEESYWIIVTGAVKGDPDMLVGVDLDLGPVGQPGTYIWRLKNPTIGATVSISSQKDFKNRHAYMDTATNSSQKLFALEGSTTLLKPDPDHSNVATGFFSGHLSWMDNNQKDHFITVRGHFAVPVKKIE